MDVDDPKAEVIAITRDPDLANQVAEDASEEAFAVTYAQVESQVNSSSADGGDNKEEDAVAIDRTNNQVINWVQNDTTGGWLEVGGNRLAYPEEYPSLESPDDPLEVNFELPASSGVAVNDNSDWVIGIYMRMENPQGGKLEPITRIKLCGKNECHHDEYLPLVGEQMGQVTFHSSTTEFMTGRSSPGWPLSLTEWGDGFDVYVEDESGVAIIGPIPFNIDEPEDEEVVTGTQEDKDSYTRSQQTAVSSSSATTLSESTLTTTKTDYDEGEDVAVTFVLESDLTSIYSDADLTGWSIGIYMRMSRPQGGAKAPIVSIPLCGSAASRDNFDVNSCAVDDISDHEGHLVFGDVDTMMFKDGDWPMDSTMTGTGYDLYMLNRNGEGVIGPIMFNIVCDDIECNE